MLVKPSSEEYNFTFPIEDIQDHIRYLIKNVTLILLDKILKNTKSVYEIVTGTEHSFPLLLYCVFFLCLVISIMFSFL